LLWNIIFLCIIVYIDQKRIVFVTYRQPTPFDHVCYSVGDDGVINGSRVFRDCDELMQKVMCQMLSAEQLQEWESGRTARLNEYAKQRQC